MLFVDDGAHHDFGGSYVYRFDAVANLVFCDRAQDCSPYVCTVEQSNACLAEYRAWCDKFKLSPNNGLIAAVSSVDTNKNALLIYLDQQASKFEDNLNKDMYFTSSLGFKVNGDRRTKDNLQDLITFFDLQAKEGKIAYRDYDNQDQALTKEQLQTLLTEHVTNGQMLYTMKWQLQSKINAAETLDDLHDITIAFPMSDFSKKVDVDTGLVE